MAAWSTCWMPSLLESNKDGDRAKITHDLTMGEVNRFPLGAMPSMCWLLQGTLQILSLMFGSHVRFFRLL